MAISSPGNYVIRTSENVLLGIAKEIDLLYYIMKILNCVNIEYLCTQKHGLSIMLFGCHKKKTVVPPKNCWQLLTSIITIIIQMTETMATLTIFTFTSEKLLRSANDENDFLIFIRHLI